MKHNSSETAPPESAGWLPRERALAMVLVGATVIAVYLCYLLVAPFLSAIAWAVALALVSYPIYDWLRLHVYSRNLAAIITVTLVALVLVVPTLLLAQQLFVQIPKGVRLSESRSSGGPVGRVSAPLSAFLRLWWNGWSD